MSLAIGANVGTTVTAVLGSLASNKNGKRLAVAHFIFNIITGLIAVIFIYQLKDLVDILSPMIAIADTDYAMKLALFHTIFNVIGVLVVSPFTKQLVVFLERLFITKEKGRGKPKYLTDEVMEIPASALEALRKETIHLYDKSLEAIVHAMNLHRKEIFSNRDIQDIVEQSNLEFEIDIDQVYQTDIKNLYSEILKYSSKSQSYMDMEDNHKVYELKLTARNIIEMVKDIRELQRNLNSFTKSNNWFMIHEYNELRKELITIFRSIEEIRHTEIDATEIMTQLQVLKEKASDSEFALNKNIDTLIRDKKINSKMASSLINDVGFTL